MPRTGKLPLDLKLAYGVGQVSEGAKNAAMGAFLIFYYSQVLGMPPALASSGVGTSLIFDALDDPLIGSISDHWRSKWGRRHPFMFASILPFALCFFLLFN